MQCLWCTFAEIIHGTSRTFRTRMLINATSAFPLRSSVHNNRSPKSSLCLNFKYNMWDTNLYARLTLSFWYCFKICAHVFMKYRFVQILKYVISYIEAFGNRFLQCKVLYWGLVVKISHACQSTVNISHFLIEFETANKQMVIVLRFFIQWVIFGKKWAQVSLKTPVAILGYLIYCFIQCVWIGALSITDDKSN